MNERIIINDIVKNIEAEKEEVKRKIDELPHGYLKVNRSGKYTQWYAVLVGNSSSIGRKNGWRLARKSRRGNGVAFNYYLPREETKFAEKLALREYYERRLADIDRLIVSLNEYFNESAFNDTTKETHQKYTSNIHNDYLWKGKEFTTDKQQLADKAMGNKKSKYDAWMYADYPSNPKNSEKLIYKSDCKIMMRSRIEVLIANLLYYYELPFRYEQKFEGRWNVDFYPDFLIINPETGKEYVWEHLGLLHDNTYIKEAVWKYDELIRLGYIPGDTLLLTGECKENSVNMNAIYSTVQYIRNDRN